LPSPLLRRTRVGLAVVGRSEERSARSRCSMAAAPKGHVNKRRDDCVLPRSEERSTTQSRWFGLGVFRSAPPERGASPNCSVCRASEEDDSPNPSDALADSEESAAAGSLRLRPESHCAGAPSVSPGARRLRSIRYRSVARPVPKDGVRVALQSLRRVSAPPVPARSPPEGGLHAALLFELRRARPSTHRLGSPKRAGPQAARFWCPELCWPPGGFALSEECALPPLGFPLPVWDSVV